MELLLSVEFPKLEFKGERETERERGGDI